MPKTLIKSRLHSNKQKPEIKREKIILNQIYLHIFKYSSRNFYQEMVLLSINELRRFSFIR